ncbi:GNAT family N-acetyltransferase [Candidatus Saccharibacteria bacterium]|nr:GNAT family N-acetyltransferase [Candidatus Saccharibacteria bacterium]
MGSLEFVPLDDKDLELVQQTRCFSQPTPLQQDCFSENDISKVLDRILIKLNDEREDDVPEIIEMDKRGYLSAFTVKEHGSVVAFYTLSACHVEVPSQLVVASKAGDIENFFPGAKIHFLLVKHSEQSKGIGSNIINHVKNALCDIDQMAIRFLVVDALSTNQALKFYNKHNFRPLDDVYEEYLKKDNPIDCMDVDGVDYPESIHMLYDLWEE